VAWDWPEIPRFGRLVQPAGEEIPTSAPDLAKSRAAE